MSGRDRIAAARLSIMHERIAAIEAAVGGDRG